jgi:hypothetical protein
LKSSGKLNGSLAELAVALENSDGPVATRTPDLYRVKVGNALSNHQMISQVIDSIEN